MVKTSQVPSAFCSYLPGSRFGRLFFSNVVCSPFSFSSTHHSILTNHRYRSISYQPGITHCPHLALASLPPQPLRHRLSSSAACVHHSFPSHSKALQSILRRLHTLGSSGFVTGYTFPQRITKSNGRTTSVTKGPRGPVTKRNYVFHSRRQQCAGSIHGVSEPGYGFQR